MNRDFLFLTYVNEYVPQTEVWSNMLDPVHTTPNNYLSGQIFMRIHLAITRHYSIWMSFESPIRTSF